MGREKGVGERDAEGGRKGMGRKGGEELAAWHHGFWKGGEISPPRSFLKVGAYAPHSQQSSSDKCNGEVGS